MPGGGFRAFRVAAAYVNWIFGLVKMVDARGTAMVRRIRVFA